MKTTQYIRQEKAVATSDRGGIRARWRFGRLLVEAKAGRNQLPHGLRASLLAAAARAGLKLSDAEISYRIQCAETYRTEAELATAVTSFGSWTALRDAGFPAVEAPEPDGSDPDHIEAQGLGVAPDEWEQLQLDIPGLKDEISIRGRTVPLVRGEDGAKVADVAAYLEMCQEKHANFGKTIDKITESLATMREGSGGDDQANAIEAWEAATGTSAYADPDDDLTEDAS